MRDIKPPLGDVAEDFASDTSGTCLAIGHHTVRGRDDCHTQAIHDLWQFNAALVYTQTRACYTVAALDDGTARVVFQIAFQQWFFIAIDTETLDIAFVFKHSSNGNL